MLRFYVRVSEVQTDDPDSRISSVWDSRSRIADGVGKRFVGSPRTALMKWLNEFDGRVMSIYTDDDRGTKELVAWLETT